MVNQQGNQHTAMTLQELIDHKQHLEQLHQLMMMDFDLGVKRANTQRRADLEQELEDLEAEIARQTQRN
jgi:hypothetical protein